MRILLQNYPIVKFRLLSTISSKIPTDDQDDSIIDSEEEISDDQTNALEVQVNTLVSNLDESKKPKAIDLDDGDPDKEFFAAWGNSREVRSEERMDLRQLIATTKLL
jgi:hypothetical protein